MMLYLASRSPRRRQLLRQLGVPFRVVHSTYRETIRRREPPSANAMRNAAGKARRAVVPNGAAGIVIGADTFLYFKGRIIGKPRTLGEARWMLRRLCGRSHWVYTGICLRDLATGRIRTAYEKTRVTFHPLTERQLARLVPRMAPLDKAGGYALQADAGELIARIAGSRSNVIGLPLELLRRQLRRVNGQCLHLVGAVAARPGSSRPPAERSLRAGALRTPGGGDSAAQLLARQGLVRQRGRAHKAGRRLRAAPASRSRLGRRRAAAPHE